VQTQPPGHSGAAESLPGGAGRFLVRLVVLFLPAAVIALGALVGDGPNRWMYWAGAGLVGFLGAVLVPQARLGQPATALAVIAQYVLAQVWLWFSAAAYYRHWFPHFAQGVLLTVPVVLFAATTLVRTGVHDLRRARLILDRLRWRRDWPADRGLIQALPDVLALREALHQDATPALAALHGTRPEVQVAVLAALAYRRHWRRGESELVLQTAQQADDPAVRTAAITALVHSNDRFLLETLVAFLTDPEPSVRRAAAEAAVADSGRHWSTLRYGVHAALSERRFRDDGPMPLGTGELPAAVVTDFHAWAAEGGTLARRATQTLVAYYGQLLNARSDAEALAEDLRRRILDKRTAAILRAELAQLLHDQGLFPAAALEPLLAATQPVALRLLAADALLAGGVHSEAERTLRQIARLPNREITLTVAQIVQKRLGVDLGLNLQRLPAVKSRPAAEISRRVMQWAAEATPAPPDAPAKLPLPDAREQPRPRAAASGSDWDLGTFPDPTKLPPADADSGVVRW